MKKIISMLMVLSLFTVFILPVKEANALGVIGSNALKQAVVGSWEQAGVKFGSKEAKEKAFDRWQMKTYEKWKEDELAGKNADLWAQYNAILQGDAVPFTKNPVAEKDGIGRMLIDSTIFGLAVTIGAEMGYEIENAQANKLFIKNLSMNPPTSYEGVDLTESFKFEVRKEVIDELYRLEVYYLQPNGIVSLFHRESSPGIDANYIAITSVVPDGNGISVSYSAGSINYDGTSNDRQSSKFLNIPYADFVKPHESGGFAYNYMPNLSDVPEISSSPLTEVISRPYDEVIPELPDFVPVEVPLNDELWDGVINTPYEFPIPNPKPGEGENPDIDTGVDPNKPIIPTPNPETPPYPEIEKPPEEFPEHPEKTEATETPNLFEKLWEWLKGILDALFKILNAIIALPFTLLELLWDFLFDIAKALFIPSDGFWDDNITELKKVIWSDEIDEMIDEFGAVGDGSGGMFKDIVVSLMGVDGLVVIDSDSINSILDNIHSWVRGVFYPFLILFNINSFYKLIRGTSLVEATRGLANRAKEE